MGYGGERFYVCDEKIPQKGGWTLVLCLFPNRDDNLKLPVEAARWWIETHELDHFEKALKIKSVLQRGM
ncbi:MAG TPA: hypothetical protein ENJ90_02250 [Devosia sp.]|nr:hypothetical protein [Devosia sp.]